MARGLAKRIREQVQASRSPAYQWLWANYHEVVQVAGVRGSWKGLLAAATEAGVKINAGDPPTMPALRSAWRRVEMDKDRLTNPPPTRKKPPRKRPATAPVAVSQPKPAPTNPPTSAAADDGGLSDVLQKMDARKGQMPKPFK